MPNKVKVTLGATVPVIQYGNLQPVVEVEGDNYESAMREAESYITEFWNKYVENGKTLKVPDVNTELERLTDMFGNEVDYDATSHTYSWEGIKYLSGSEYAESFRKPFDKERISRAMADKHGVSAEDIKGMWKLKGQISRDYGSAIHGALEYETKYGDLNRLLGKDPLHNHPMLKLAVESFIELRSDEIVESEVLIVDHKAKKAGRVDRLQITSLEEQRCRIGDYKTNADIEDDLEFYWKQLEFYASIVEANGWSVDGLDIFHYNGEWKVYTHEYSKGEQVEKVK